MIARSALARASMACAALFILCSPAAGLDLELDGPLPVDAAVTVGELDNGLRYFIRHNEKPENRVLMRLIVNAGSLQEQESQRGLAHFLEHMAFNGTERFEKQEIVNFMERVGMRFGSHVNAYTSHNETVYMLELPSDSNDRLSAGFDILRDWADGIAFDPMEIEKERGVILEEWRSRQGAGERLNERQLPYIYYQSRYAQRKPIGSMIVVRNAPRERFVEFYEDWYRPELMGIVIVGDIDPVAMEKKVQENFADLENPEDSPERVENEVPDHSETLFSIETDPELTIASLQILTKRPPDPDKTGGDYRSMIVNRLYFSMLNQRLDEQAREPEPPYLQAGVGKTRIAREKEALQQSVVFIGERYQDGVNALISEINRAVRDGFSETELERVKKDVLRSLERAYEERDKTESDTYAREYTRSFLVGEPIPGIELELEMTESFLEGIDLDEVNGVGEGFAQESGRVVLFSAPEKDGFEIPSEKELQAMIEQASDVFLDPYEDIVSDEPLLADIPEGGTISDETYHESVNAYDWTLSNGVRIIAKETDFQNEQVLMTAFSPGGSSLVADDEYVSAMMMTSILGESGMGDFNSITLEKLMAGKSLGFSTYLGDQYEGFNGSATPRDLETLFKLIYLQSMQPRLDQQAVLSLDARLRAMIANRSKAPQSVFQDAIETTLYGEHPRHRTLTPELLDEIDPELALHIFKSRFGDFSDFTFVFVGSFDLAELKTLTASYLGGLPVREREEKGLFRGDEPKSGQLSLSVSKGLEEKTAVRVIFSGEAEWYPENEYALTVARDLLSIRLREALREESSGTYGVGVFGSLTREPRERYVSGFNFSCDPQNADALTAQALAVIADLQQRGPRPENIQKVKEIHIRAYEENQKTNGFWLRQLASIVQTDQPFESILEFSDLVASIPVEKTQEALQRYFSFDNMLVAKLNPERER